MKKGHRLADYQFHLPEELIAQHPIPDRSSCRLMALLQPGCTAVHSTFNDICDYLQPGDLLIKNNVKVLQARVFFRRKTGGLVEFIFLKPLATGEWETICNRTSRLTPGEVLSAEGNEGFSIRVIQRVDEKLVVAPSSEITHELLQGMGSMPLPPYIKRSGEEVDSRDYQTVYAASGMAAAAPTAGLHFTEVLLEKCRSRGILMANVTLDVSWGTFQPVRQDDITLHPMHKEHFVIPRETAALFNEVRQEKSGRVIGVGTTTLRALESAMDDGTLKSGEYQTDIFIYPPYEVKSLDCLITNFHTPGSTLLMLVSAFAGYDCIMESYKKAIDEGYRFFSYGDAMFLEKSVYK